MKDPRHVIIKPVVSEKSYGLIEDDVYTFVVNREATKPEIKDAVEQLFGVRVRKVNTLLRRGKRVRSRRKQSLGRRSDQKRAIVTLAEGDSIDVFEA
jgi:large subunit ribosomal protein L23